jgi:NADPH-dependent glutamate synthase beta subunit-like oxidoreductase
MADKEEPIPKRIPEEDLPISPMSLGSMTVNRTGSWKYMEPYFEDQTPPCVDRCPVHNDISMLMRFAEDGDYDGGARFLLRDNPFPSILGRVCSHPCEQPCNRKAMGGAVRIQGVERFLGDYALENEVVPELPEIEKSPVAVVGAGPAGLAAAFFLRTLGHDVTVFEKSNRLGGLLWREIPPFRLPQDILEKELDRLTHMDIRFELGKALGRDVSLAELRRKFKAVILTIGQGKSRELGVPDEDHPAVHDGVGLLAKIHRGEKVDLGKRVVVVGGGNNAMACARTLLRLGREVKIVYRRSRREMLASKVNITDTIDEEIPIEFQTEPVRLVIQNDQLIGIECVKTELGELDASKRRQAVKLEGTEFIIPTDSVVVAMGKHLDFDELDESVDINGAIETDFQYHTSVPGVYAAGDCVRPGVTGGDVVGDAVRMGREAASEVHSDLEGGNYIQPNPLKRRGASAEISKFKSFNRAYHETKEPVPLHVRDPQERIKDVSEYVETLQAGDVQLEGARCIKCGTCITCDNCHLFCPDAAIVKKEDGSGYEILCDYCKGCGVCVEECPRGAIHLRLVEQMTPDSDPAGEQS